MTSPPARARAPRDPVIDGFRGIAVLSVLSYHYLFRWAPPEAPRNVYGYADAMPSIFHLGYLGVHVFFVISGLVITMTVLRSRSTLEFIIRRTARLFPPFVVAVLLTTALSYLLPWPIEFARSLTIAAENLALPLLPLQTQYVDGAYWSLAVEIKFYALVAIGYYFLGRRFWIVAAFLSLFEMLLWISGHHLKILAPWTPFFLLGMGAWLGVKERDRLAAVVLIGLALLQIPMCAPGWGPMTPAPAWEIATGLAVMISLLLGLFACDVQWFPAPLVFMGRISYSLYLIHQKLGVAMIVALVRLDAGEIASPIIAAAAVVAVAFLMFRYVEQPGDKAVRRLGERFLVPRSGVESARMTPMGPP